jgi:hypothetical protein
MQLNVSGGRNFTNGIWLMAGVDNLFNNTDPKNMPCVPGYIWYLTVSLDIQKLTHRK